MQPLIDQGRRVWLWPDKDGIDKWQEVADKLGSEQVQVYTKFFDTCWIPEDGDKADAADITIRIMGDPTFKPREAVEKTEEEQQPTEQQTDEEREREAIRRDVALHGDEPFLDPEEMTDPELHRRREILRQRYNFNKSRNRPTPPTTDIEGVKSVGEILKDHPLIQKLINNEVRDSATD